MLSRVADSLYWTTRYLERAEHTARLIDINMGLMLDRSRVSAERRWQRVLTAVGSAQGVGWGDEAAGSTEPGRWMGVTALVHALCFDTGKHASITACIFAARENARQIRDEISTEQWQRLNGLFHEISRLRTATPSERNLAEFLPTIIDGVHLFQGVTDTTLSHGEGWHVLRTGRYLERAWSITTLLDIYEREVFLGEDTNDAAGEYLEWIGLLRICTAYEAFCRVHTSDLTHERILEFLLLDPDFPHSVRYAVDALHNALEAIQQHTRTQHGGELMRVAGRLKSMLAFAQIGEILAQEPVRYLRRILEQCREIHDLIYAVYIQYSVETALAV